MTKLISGRVKKTPSANVSASRYEFIRLSETEPDLGVPAANGYILTANVDGTRRWAAIIANEATNAITANFANTAGTANTALRANVATQADSANTAVFATSSSTSNTALRSNVATQADSANTAVFATNSTTANTVLSISNFTTSNLAEGSNLYYTNARVYSNIIAALPTYSGNVGAGNITIGSGTGGSLIGANLISAVNISATNWLNLYTANVVESGNNIFYTNARVFANVSPLLDRKANVVDLTTANVTELNNLYYTNARVLSNITAYLAANPVISTYGNANVGAFLTTYTGNISAGNIIANTIIIGTGGSFTGANLISANNVSATNWLNLYTANVIESPNALYYTNARVLANVTPLLNLKANVTDLTTANVVELNNLYYTNARVASNVIALLPTLAGDNIVIAANGRISANLLGISVNTVVGNLNVSGNIIANGFVSPTATSATITSTGNLNIIASDAVNINSTNVIATGNVIANTFISTGPGSGLISSTGNVTVSATGIVTLSGSGGVVINGPLTANITTANVTELNNLYYTNSRVRSALSGGTGVAVDSSSGIISIGQNVSTSSNVTFGGLNVTGPVNFYGNVTTHSSNNLSISDNMIYLNNGSPSANPDLGIAFNYNDGVYHNAGFFRDATDGTFKVFDNYDPAPDANIFINTAHASFRLANLSATTLFGNVQGTVSTLSNFTTSNLAEGTNKYFSNALARNALSAGDATIIYDPTTGTIRATANVTATIETTVNNLSTANVTEAASNLYYTNARVYSNVIALLSTYTGNISAGNIIANTIITGTGSGGSFTGANLISAGNISSTTWLNLYTANVVETSGNLYFTNARVVSALSAGSGIAISGNGQISSTTTLNASSVVGLNTANVSESNSNLYYTNARVLSNVIAALPTYTGNINAGNIFANTFIAGQGLGGSITGANLISANNISASVITANTIIGGGSGGSVTGANLISTNNISSLNWIGLYTANVIETSGNLYFTNARVQSNVIGFLPSLAGDNITIAANGRISATASATVNVLSIVGLTTANVSESNSNLYYTNARVLSNVTAYLAANPQGGTFGNANVGAFLTTYTGNINAGNINANAIVAGTGLGGSITGANLISANNISASVITANTIIGAGTGGSITGANLISTNNISSVNWIGLYTANVIETSGNLYFTNARVVSALSAGSGISLSGNGQISSTATVTATSVTGLNTANVNEFGGNLYYSNARVLSNVTAYLAANPAISTYGNANVGAFLTTYTGNINAGNVIANSFISTAPGTGTLTATGDFNIVAGGNIRLTGNVFANTFISTATGTGSITSTSDFNINAASNVNITAGNINLNSNNIVTTGNITASRISATIWQNLYTANVIETSGNLYFTNARVLSNVLALLPSLAGDNITIAANGRISATASATVNVLSIVGLTTANVSESNSNLYYTNARVLSNVLALLPTYTGNINAGNVIANSFVAATTGTGTLTATGDFNIVSGGNIRLTGNVYSNTFISTATGTGSITSTSNFNINAASNVSITAANINLNSSNVIASGNVIATKFFGDGSSLTGVGASSFSGNTNGITEGTNNLYYTNTRVYSNVIALLPTLAGNNITIEANGRISANVSSTVFATAIVGLTTANVTEVGSNLYFTNTRVVSALSAGEGITLSANGQISGGVHAITDSQTFAGGNANITLGTSVSLARRIIVTIDGLVQIPITDYTVSGTILTLIPTPSPNSTIEVKFFGNEAITTQTFNPFLLAGL